jgi:hypothetical protein
MKKNMLIGSLFTCITASIYPSWANDLSPAINASPSVNNLESAEYAPAIASQPGLNSAKSEETTNSQRTKVSTPKKVFSVATALLVGTPVCVVRRTKYEERYGVNGLIGSSDSKCKKVLASVFWLPFAVVCGTAEAPFDALANGLMYPAFSKDQLSQGKLIQNN